MEERRIRTKKKEVESMLQKRMLVRFYAANKTVENHSIWKPDNREGACLLVIKGLTRRKEAILLNKPLDFKQLQNCNKVTFLNKKNNLAKKKFSLAYFGGFGGSVYNDINIYEFGKK